MLRRCVPQAAIDLIKEYEGFRPTSYLCPAGRWTLGYGHTRNIRAGMMISRDDAEIILRGETEIVAEAIEKLVKVPLTDNQFSALISFVFNVGVKNFENSTLLRLLNQGWYEQVPVQLGRWNKVNGEALGGLSRRRASEARLWRASDDGATQGEDL